MQATHTERHFAASEVVKDLVLGVADGLTVPFALAAGLSGAVTGNTLIVVAGVAEIAAGTIAMGLGGYLAARSEADHYASERQREQWEVKEKPMDEMEEVYEVFETYGIGREDAKPIANALIRRPESFVDFMMRFELGLERPEPNRALISAITIGGGYALGGFIPLSPYIFVKDTFSALITSIVLTLLALLIFGYIKGRFMSGGAALRSAVQTVLVGGTAAAVAFGIARLLT